MTDPILVADSYLIGVLDAISQVARTLGKDDDSRRYKKEHDELLDVFRSEYVTPTGRLACDSQTAYVLALQFDLLTSEQRKIGVERLVHLITKNRYRIGTGFAGTPVILDMLARHGQLETAYKMLEETKCPSWLYPVSMGATTIWERWDSMLPDGSINVSNILAKESGTDRVARRDDFVQSLRSRVGRPLLVHGCRWHFTRRTRVEGHQHPASTWGLPDLCKGASSHPVRPCQMRVVPGEGNSEDQGGGATKHYSCCSDSRTGRKAGGKWTARVVCPVHYGRLKCVTRRQRPDL